jgi:NTP pyrophosphatase (non-canonical NTP hydrolase)
MDIDVRPVVAEFALAMEAKLRKNDHKPEWQNDTAADLLVRLEEEEEELYDAVHDETADNTEVMDEATDVANFSLMVWDAARNYRIS